MTPRLRWFLLGALVGFLLGVAAMVCADIYYSPPPRVHTVMASR